MNIQNTLLGFPIIESDFQMPHLEIEFGGSLISASETLTDTNVNELAKVLSTGANAVMVAIQLYHQANTDRFNCGMAFGL